MLSYLIRGLGLGIYAGVLPGPTQAFILSKTIKNGWKRALPLALVPLISDLPLAILFCLLVSTLPSNLITIIQIVGGGYLVFLGIQTWKSAVQNNEIENEAHQPTGFWQTVLVNLTNPNVYVYWGTIGAPIVLNGWNEQPSSGLAFLVGMYTMLVLSVATMIMLFGFTGHLPNKTKFWIMRILGVAVVSFGFYQTITGVVSLLRL